MNRIVFISVFLICLFIYTHIRYHIKKVNDLDIYDMGQLNKEKLEEVCRLKQPVTFIINDNDIETEFSLTNMTQKYPDMRMNVHHSTEIPLEVSIQELNRLIKQSGYTSYNNIEITKDPVIIKQLERLNNFLSPPLTIYKSYDLWIGGSDALIKDKQHNYYRQYIYITNGYIECMLTTPDGSKRQSIVVNQSEILFIPPYWTYDITFKKTAFICVYRFDTVFSILTRLPKLCMDYIDNKQEVQYALKTKPLEPKLKTINKDIDKVNDVSSSSHKDEGGHDTSCKKRKKRKKRKSKTDASK